MSGDFIDAFLLLDGIKGECLDADHAGEGVIEIDEFSLSGDAPGHKKKKKPAKTPSTFGRPEGGRFGNVPPPPVPDDDDDDEDSIPFKFDVTKGVDSSSPALYLAYCKFAQRNDKTESVFKTGKLWMRRAGGSTGHIDFLVWEFTNLHITSFEWKCGGDGIPSEEIRFTFATCRVIYTPQELTGQAKTAIPAGWDFIKCVPK